MKKFYVVADTGKGKYNKIPVPWYEYLWAKVRNYECGLYNKMIYIICPVRNLGSTYKTVIEYHVKIEEESGNIVHFPPRDVDQIDETGLRICCEHRLAMFECDEVHIFWDKTSTGSHFDLGMAFSCFKKIVLIKSYQGREDSKSFLNVIHALQEKGNDV